MPPITLRRYMPAAMHADIDAARFSMPPLILLRAADVAAADDAAQRRRCRRLIIFADDDADAAAAYAEPPAPMLPFRCFTLFSIDDCRHCR